MYILTDNNRKSRPYIELDQDMLIYIDADVSGNSNSGSLVNGPTFNSANGGGVVFDGTNDYSN